MADAMHKTPLKHLVRRAGLRAISRLPIQMGAPAERQRILLIRPDHLGDVLLATPAIRALRALRPTAEIHALTGPWSADVLETCDAVDQVLTIPFPGFSRAPSPNLRSPYELAWDTGRKLRLLRYSAALILRPDHWWGALVAWLAGIPVRIGYALPDVEPFLTQRVPFQRGHAVEQNAWLVERLTGMALDPSNLTLRYTVASEERAWTNQFLGGTEVSADDRLIVLHAGAGTAIKLWEPQRWATVADRLARQSAAKIVLTGSEAEIPLTRAIAAHMSEAPIIMAGETSVGTLAALLERAALALGPDSGPLHLAAAVGTPTVALFGPADPDEFRPWGPLARHLVLTTDIGCRPCRILDWPGDSVENHPCVREISIERVVEASHRAMNAAT
ncbi:MAG: glycosyltransferase family 9 protein [Anaerolineae bacterium]|nr:glycosyltransferase family 9 protein [Anaerolineae bacterium]